MFFSKTCYIPVPKFAVTGQQFHDLVQANDSGGAADLKFRPGHTLLSFVFNPQFLQGRPPQPSHICFQPRIAFNCDF